MKVRKKACILLGLVVLLPLSAAIYGFTAPREYRAISRLSIEPHQSANMGLDTLELGPSVHVENVPNTELIAVSAHSRDPHEAAELANKAVSRMETMGFRAKIVEKAVPPRRPYTPNIPLLIGSSLVAAFCLALGGLGLCIRQRRYPPVSA